MVRGALVLVQVLPVGVWDHVRGKRGVVILLPTPVLVAGHTETTEAGRTETSL